MSKSKFQKMMSLIGGALSSFFELVKFEKIIDKNTPGATIKRIHNMKRVAVMIGLLILVLVIIILLLRGCQGGKPPHGSVDIPGNVIDPMPPVITPTADLEFNKDNAEENLSFDVEGMNGGDSESILCRVKATYNSDFILKYDMTVRDEENFKKLAEVLKIKVELMGEDGDALLYDGLLSDMETLEIALTADESVTKELVFRITAYLDSPLDEQYYGQKLMADMSWWIDGQDNISVANNEFIAVIIPTHPVIVPNLNFATVNKGDNTTFDMQEIHNGDSESRYFSFEITHGEDITVVIDNIVTIDSVLKNVLKAKVELVGENGNTVLYEGLLTDLSTEHTIPKNDSNKTTLYYKVTVIADGLSEAYCDTRLVCDFSWSVKNTSEQLKIPGNSFEAYKMPYTPPETATSIELTAKDGYDNVPFNVENMLPGDSATRYYCVSVTHDDTQTVCFSSSLDTEQKLSAVMRVKVEQLVPNAEDIVLYDGLMRDCTDVDVSVTARSETVTAIYYRITVYTNGAEVGNEYAGENLTADFSWQLQ